MFAVSSFIGAPVTAAPARATRAARSTPTVALFNKKPASISSKPKTISSKNQPKEKKPFMEWFMNIVLRDSGKMGAGYEDELKSGKFKKIGKK
eukprot:CAMPEP_0197589768 /NCGR_PEP_ID=MMETSP1326-20131121/10594_1 /TAXON_ID=1155430 /ORGANISM="Genus nov. species nov., Strain RCC2288" /LENGTH=92 /DNA_ID=CAMNT_0043154741 /DNA_START=74 /DNA_END=352 /DNA_ORIENTATION=+